MAKKRSKLFYAGCWGTGFAVVVIIASWILSSGPDFDIHLTREVPSDVDAKTLGHAIESTREWPKWFYSLESAEAMDILGRPYPLADQTVQKGSVVRLKFDPQRGPWRKFEILVNVIDYVPNRKISLQVVQDSNHKLSVLFDKIEWTVEIEPTAQGNLVRGLGVAHTALWRSRLFGKLFEKILMNQAFYPDLIHLAMLGKAEPTNPFQETPN